MVWIHFQEFWKLEQINGQDHFEWKINDPDSSGIWSKFLSVGVHQKIHRWRFEEVLFWPIEIDGR
jgi:hypothetical protein